jgi:hypothetical protein
MKKIVYLLLTSLIACQHADVLYSNNTVPPESREYKTLFDDKMNKYASSSDLKLKEISAEFKPTWEDAIIEGNENIKTLIVPIKLKSTFKVQGVIADRFCVFEKDVKTNNVSTNIVLVYSDHLLQPDDKLKLLGNYRNQKIPGFTGRISLYSLNYTLKEYAEYKDGIVVKNGIVVENPDPVKNKARGARLKGCTDWYWVVYVNGSVHSITFSHTTCDCEYTRGARISDVCGEGGSPEVVYIDVTSPPPGSGALAVFTDPCDFKNDMLARSYNTNPPHEYSGVITADGHFMVTQQLGQFGGSVAGMSQDAYGQAYYVWPVNPNQGIPQYGGLVRSTIEGVDCWGVPVVAFVHTHPVAAGMTLLNDVSPQDRQAAMDYPSQRHYIIADGLIADYTMQSTTYNTPVPCWNLY